MTFIFEECCKCTFKKLFFVAVLKVTHERAGSGDGPESVIQRYGFDDPDPKVISIKVKRKKIIFC
jgi:hypothetical protein